MANFCGYCGAKLDGGELCPVCGRSSAPKKAKKKRGIGIGRPAGKQTGSAGGRSTGRSTAGRSSAGRSAAGSGRANAARGKTGVATKPAPGKKKTKGRKKGVDEGALVKVLIGVAAVLAVAIVTLIVIVILPGKTAEPQEETLAPEVVAENEALSPFEDAVREYRKLERAKFVLKEDTTLLFANDALATDAQEYAAIHPEDSWHIYYAFEDLSGDGAPELAIGAGPDTGHITVYSLFTVINGKLTNLFERNELGKEDVLLFYQDNRFGVLSYTAGTLETVTYYYLPSGHKKRVSERYAHETGLYIHLDPEGEQYKISKDTFTAAIATADADVREADWHALKK